MQMTALGLAACLAAGLTGSCWAQELKATQKLSDTVLGFETAGSYSNFILTVTGPNGFHTSTTPQDVAPSIDLRRFGALDDGIYHYQLSASAGVKSAMRSAVDDGREKRQSDVALKSVSISGTFPIKGGMIVKPSSAKPARHDKDAQ